MAGVDGCRGGWLVATVALGGGPPSLRVVGSFAEIASGLANGTVERVALDMPIGLATAGPRRCDQLARKLCGPRRSSVFPAPVRAVLAAGSYGEALTLSRAASGVGLSKQTWNLVAKIREVDQLIGELPPGCVAETHPELAFAALCGGPLADSKHTRAGLAARIGALATVFPDVETLVATPLVGAAIDDMTDALVLAWSARRQHLGLGASVGDEVDSRGLPMVIHW